MSDQRTEQATPQRKRKARDRGDIVRSRDLVSGAGLLAGLCSLQMAAPAFTNRWRDCYTRALQMAGDGHGPWATREMLSLVRLAIAPVLIPAGIVMACTLGAVVLVGVSQGGGVVLNGEALLPSADRLNPATHAKQMFSMRALVRVAKALLPACVVAVMCWHALYGMLTAIPAMGLLRLPSTFAAAYSLALKTACVVVAWAGIDYAVEWRSWNQRLRMSKQEIREEVKEAMGNPQVKGKIRAMQRTMAKRKAKVDMRRASVVITNPTHYAVALEFSFDSMAAPLVLTKGRDLLAFDIREEARQAGVPIVENPPLARSLYRGVEPGQAIPYELYAAVAGILAFLFREQQEKEARERQKAKEAVQQARRTEHLQSAFKQFEGGF